MEALILAAGLGTRLRPLTDHVPKCLVPVGGVPMLERVARKLTAAGVTRLVINAHHHAEQIERFISEKRGFGVDVQLSPESPVPLETGGALVHARGLLQCTSPLLVHNADVLTDFSLPSMLQAHLESGSLATLAVHDRSSVRKLLFDSFGLVGRSDASQGLTRLSRTPAGEVEALSFAGVHILSRPLLDRLVETGSFSILVPYLRLVEEGAVLTPYRMDNANWVDIGTPDSLALAEHLAERGLFPVSRMNPC